MVTKKDNFTPRDDDKNILVRLNKDAYKELKKLALELDVSMTQLCREGIELIIKKKKDHIK